LRLVSGNVSVGLLLLAVAGSLLPASLILSGQLRIADPPVEDGLPSKEELQLCRINAVVMVIMYGCYLVFQLGTHKEEFDEDDDDNNMHIPGKARRNRFCLTLWSRMTGSDYSPASISSPGGGGGDVELSRRDQLPLLTKDHSSDRGPRVSQQGNDYANGEGDHSSMSGSSGSEGGSNSLLPQNESSVPKSYANGYFDEYEQQEGDDSHSARRRKNPKESDHPPGRMLPLGLADPLEGPRPSAGKPFCTYYLLHVLACYVLPVL
jgi:Ca2+/H+ antiporter